MDPPKVHAPVAESIASHVANYSIGFCRFTGNANEEDARASGSGTLVTVGTLSGVLTAGHVLENLPDTGNVGLVRYLNRSENLQKLKLDMGWAEKLIISSGEWTRSGPDIGFLRLPPTTAATLGATNSFLNLDKRRAEMVGAEPSSSYFDAVVGTVGRWTEDLAPLNPSTKRKGFTGLFGAGTIIKKYEVDGYDLFNFKPAEPDPGIELPSDYGGVSGGGAWRAYLKVTANAYTLQELRLLGVAFFQIPAPPRGKPVLVCQGPRSVYITLVDAIRQRWPASNSLP
jgi:hypothetical protein